MLPNRFLNSYIETGSVQKSLNFNRQKWTNQVLLCLAYSVQLKVSAFNNFTRSATSEFQKSRKKNKIVTFLKMRKKSTKSKNSIVWCFSSRSDQFVTI